MTTPATAARLGLLQISLAGVLWGTGGLAVQLVREQVPMHVVTISAWRMVLAGVVLGALLLALRGGPVLRALLRAAAFELSSGTQPPARVVINEYMDIAHGFFSGEEPRFANGVLDAMARSLRAAEFQR